MISPRLKNIFIISIPVFIAHGLEEYATGFYNIDPIFKFFFHYFDAVFSPQVAFLLFQIMFWLVLIIVTFLITNQKYPLRLMIIPGLIYLFELSHFWEALSLDGYYSGVITAMAFPIIGFLFWKELLKDFDHA